ncbi:DUF4132 domain-containing protein [Saccharopolyspora shandongensis]|uniref:DUF4132 domain-containing protein n=1 Tax=Saccharopolyspora shandongensis TaxID=418495 RepID=UPI003419D3EF
MSTSPDALAGITLPDEDTFVLPEEWRNEIFPRRGGAPGPAIGLDDTAVEVLQRHERDIHDVVQRMEGDPELADLARAHLRGDVTPLSAAVIATIATQEANWPKVDGVRLFADAWIATRGLTFAAEATAELARVYDHKSMSRTRYNYLRFRTDSDDDWGYGTNEDIAERVRAFLAVADENDYRDVVSTLAQHRNTLFQRVVVSFLVPTETAWTDELCQEVSTIDIPQVPWRLLLSSVGTAEQLARLMARDRDWIWLRGRPALYGTMLDVLGIAAVPAFMTAIESGEPLTPALVEVPSDEAFQVIISTLDDRGVHTDARRAMRRYPVRALRLLADASTGTSKTATYAARLLRSHVRDNPDLVAAVLPGLAPEVRAAIDGVDDRTGLAPESPADALPRLLVEPPWTRKRKPPKRAVVKDLVAEVAPAISWTPGEQQLWESSRDDYHQHVYANADWDKEFEKYRKYGISDYHVSSFFAYAPVERARPLLRAEKRERWWYSTEVKRIVARYELDAAPRALQVARDNPTVDADKLIPLFTVDIARYMADSLVRLKSVRLTAIDWLHRHGPNAARALVPDAVGKAGRQQRSAEAALRVIAKHFGNAEVVAAAREYGTAAMQAVEALLAADPTDLVLARVPDVIEKLDLDLLPQVLLRDRQRGLPQEGLQHLITMLAMSKRGEIYAGIDAVKKHLDPAALAALGWKLFEQTGREGWAFHALAAIGDDDTVRRLTPIIRAWPGEGGHAKAVVGLEILTAIGSEVALMHLHGIATKVKFKGIKAKAQEKITAIAAELGLTADQLADRLVPDFGLGEHGSLTLDYGPRRFTVGFDEQLTPYVADEDGKRRKSLPKPGARDDQALAPAAYERFAALKKDVRTIAKDRIQHFERAMVDQRDWHVGEFQRLFIQHPLLRHISRRLLWSTDDGRQFRIAEDHTFADIDDDTLEFPESTRVHITHPLQLAEVVDQWREVFADYEIVQPFPQLDRPVHTLTDDEKAATELNRFTGHTVSTYAVVGLERRGWKRAADKENGVESWISRPIPVHREIVLNLDPGIYVGILDEMPEQRLEAVWISIGSASYASPHSAITFGELDPVIASEILADLTELTRSS